MIRASILALLGILVAVPAGAENWIRVPQPEVSAYLFVSEADDAKSIFLNPGGLKTGHGMNLYVDLSGDDNEIVEYLASLQGGAWGFSYRHHDLADRGLEPNYHNGYGMPDREGNLDEYTLAAAYGPQAFQMGLSRVWTKTDYASENAASFHLGILSRPSRHFSFGVKIENIEKPRFLDGRLQPIYNYGLSLRPLPGTPELLTLSVEGVHGDGFTDMIDLSYGARVHLESGLDLALTMLDPHEGGLKFGGSVIFHFGRGAVGARARGVSGEADYRVTGSLQVFDQFWQRSLNPDKKVATLDLGGTYEDEASGFVLLGGRTRGTQDVVRRIDRAAEDRDIRALAVRVGSVSDAFVGPVNAHHEEIRDAMLRFRESGKPVVAYLDQLASGTEVYLASAADRVLMPPTSSVRGVGVSLNLNRYQRMFEKLGVEWEADTAGVYKSSFHSWYTDTTSARQREAIQGLVDSAYDYLVATIQNARGISDEDMAYIASGRILFPADCTGTGLVDELGWWNDALADADSLADGRGRVPRTQPLPARDYWTERWTPPRAVAVVPAYGSIHSGRSRQDWLQGGRSMGSKTVVQQLRAAAAHPEVRAIVFRIDSGGGSALASEEIRQEILRIKRSGSKPFYVSMGGVAASGGYWIAMDGDSVFASNTTLTGSIGVVWAWPVLTKLYEKLGVTSETYKRGEYADAPNLNRHLTPEEREMLDESLDFVYDNFVAGVSTGRGIPESRVRELAEGRLYLGSPAQEVGLIDELGGLQDAIEAAATKAGIQDDYRVLTFQTKKRSLLSRVIGQLGFVSDLFGAEGTDGIEAAALGP
jgi:protease-4